MKRINRSQFGTSALEVEQAISMLPACALEAIFEKRPLLRAACIRLSRLTAGTRLPSVDGRALLLSALESGAAAASNAARRNEDESAAFVHAVSARAVDVLAITVMMRVRGAWKLWNPIDEYLLDAVKRSKATDIRIETIPHPLRGIAQSQLIIASRVFSLHELSLAGLIKDESEKHAA